VFRIGSLDCGGSSSSRRFSYVRDCSVCGIEEAGRRPNSELSKSIAPSPGVKSAIEIVIGVSR
jgi:hypothetical protein